MRANCKGIQPVTAKNGTKGAGPLHGVWIGIQTWSKIDAEYPLTSETLQNVW